MSPSGRLWVTRAQYLPMQLLHLGKAECFFRGQGYGSKHQVQVGSDDPILQLYLCPVTGVYTDMDYQDLNEVCSSFLERESFSHSLGKVLYQISLSCVVEEEGHFYRYCGEPLSDDQARLAQGRQVLIAIAVELLNQISIPCPSG